MAGLIGIGRNTLGQANVGFQQSANLEDSRNAMGMQLRQARAAQRASMVTTGAGLGGSIGVNNAMAASAAAKAGTTAAGTAAGTGSVTGSAGSGALFGVPASGAPMSLAALEAGTAAGTAAGAGAGFTVSATGAPMALAGLEAGTAAVAPAVVAPAAAAPMAGVMAIATPLLIGAGAALLLDSMFDIF